MSACSPGAVPLITLPVIVVSSSPLTASSLATGASLVPVMVTVTVLVAVPSNDLTVKVSVSVSPTASDCTSVRLLSI
ncbi:hypothetical protein CDEF62S_06373 [Castellaniella defragrans]